jgi:hypothetical protein
MRSGIIAGWTLAVLLSGGVATAQQDEGPILRPAKQVAKPAGATLLVVCDLPCNWKLDGESKGHIEAGGSAKAKVEIGQHFMLAGTEDGLDTYQVGLNLNSIEQKLIQVELAPIRSRRLQEEELTRKQDEISRNAEERDKKDKDELAKGYWVDPGTGLMWAKKDNGYDVTWQQASDYCKRSRVASQSDWHLATIGELQGIYDPNVLEGVYDPIKNPKIDGMHVKGNLRLNGWYWTSTQGANSYEELAFFFGAGDALSFKLDESLNGRALCVRRPGE